MERFYICAVLVLLCGKQGVWAQEKIITGSLMFDDVAVQGISVVNRSNKMMAVTDTLGCFSIMAKEGDLLDFSGIDFKGLRKYVYKFEYNNGRIEMNLPLEAINLGEVVVGRSSGISAEGLGIISKGQVRLSPQQRKLYAQSSGLAGLLSMLSGDLKYLKMNAETEKKELLLKKLEDLFERYYYVHTLKIPVELIRGFQYYCVENSGFAKSLNQKDKIATEFFLANLATQYNEKRLEKQ